MLFNWIRLATTLLISLVLASCSSVLPWNKRGAPATEVNLAIVVDHNLLYLPTAEINGARGHMLFGSAAPRTVLSPTFYQRVRAPRFVFHMNEREDLPFAPVVLDLGKAGDAMIGSDVWGNAAVTVDYRVGLLTMQKEGIHPAYMTLYRFDAEPVVGVKVDGTELLAVVDTALPDTLVVPGGGGRRNARVSVAGTDFGTIDIGSGEVSRPRIGNRLLSKFLLTVDYGSQQVGIWRDPRIAMR